MPLRRGMRVFYSDADLIAELRRVARRAPGALSMRAFIRRSRLDPSTFKARFGGWRAALARAGLAHRAHPPRAGLRHSWRDLFANLARLARRYGRFPTRNETRRPPSRISWQTYAARFGSWRAALAAFAAALAGNAAAWPTSARSADLRPNRIRDLASAGTPAPGATRQRRRLPWRLRYLVLKRDRFRCTACGASPARDPDCELQVDHVLPLAAGGSDAAANLATLCTRCNLGKGASLGLRPRVAREASVREVADGETGRKG